jgi:hypothetical protein
MKKLGSILLCIIVIAACEKNEDEKTVLPNFAFEIGNTWYYSFQDNREMSNDTKLPYDFSVTIEKDTTINGIGGIKKVVEDYGSERFVYFAKLHPDGLYRYAFLENELVVYDEPKLEYKLPFTIGDSWVYQNGVKEVTEQEIIVSSEVSFDCFKVELKRGNNTEFEWIAPEGIIQVLSKDSVPYLNIVTYDTIWLVDTVSYYKLVNFELN